MTDTLPERTLDALPDTIDFRDAMYVPALVEVAALSTSKATGRSKYPCFSTRAKAHALLRAGDGCQLSADDARQEADGRRGGSAAMLYQMAKRCDEWPGEDYDGSSARGAMKGWHKHGACAAKNLGG